MMYNYAWRDIQHYWARGINSNFLSMADQTKMVTVAITNASEIVRWNNYAGFQIKEC